MKVVIDKRNDISVVHLCGEMDQSSLPAISKSVQTIMGDGTRSLVFEMNKVTFLDSMGAAYLLMTCKRARVKGGDIATANIPPIVRKTFDVLGMLEVFHTWDTVDEAIEHLSAGN